ncbi:MAG: CaiB/BaiF CoA transferase family protein [Candidatus Rokuibacteriota bacterium]
MTDAPLTGLTVLDFTRVLAGPWATRLLADLGARVIKIERPGEGDDTRRGYVQLEEGRADQAAYFVRVNAGKLSVAVDIAHPRGREVVLDLARVADVAIENFVPGVTARNGCDHQALAAVKPDIVYCSISGFGQTGPLSGQPAFAQIIHAISGLTHLEQADDPEPRIAYLQAADVLAGTHAFGAIMAALWRRERTGRGAYLDVSMLEALIGAEDITYGALLNGGALYRGPRAGMILHQLRGHWFTMQTVGSPQLWPRLLQLMGRPELAEDPRFATPMARREHWPDLRAIIREFLDRFESVDAALKTLTAARIPCAPVLSPADVVDHPHMAERGFFAEIPHPARGSVRVNASPYHLDGEPVRPAGAAPYRPGEHTRAVLTDVLGYPGAKIDELLSAGAIGAV